MCPDRRTRLEEKGDPEYETELDLDKIMARYSSVVVPKQAESQRSTVDATPKQQPKPVKAEERKDNVVLMLEKGMQANRPIRNEDPPMEASAPNQQEQRPSGDNERARYLLWIRAVEKSVQDCLLQGKGVIDTIYVVLPDGSTCLSIGGNGDVDTDIITAFIGEQFESFDSYSGVLQLGGIEEVELIGKRVSVLLKPYDGLKFAVVLRGHNNIRLARIYLNRMLGSIPRL